MKSYQINPENFTPEFMNEFYRQTLEIGQRKMTEGNRKLMENPPKVALKARIATGGEFSGLFLWDTVFCCMWAKYAADRFPVLDSLDNFYSLQEEDGYICREYTWDGEPCWSKDHPVSLNPPLLSWAELELYEYKVSDIERLRQVYHRLKRHYYYVKRTFQRSDKLYFGDTLGSGMDFMPRFPIDKQYSLDEGIQFDRSIALNKEESFFKMIYESRVLNWNRQMGWIDFSCQAAFNALNLSKIAEIIGETDDAAIFRGEHGEMADVINDKCYDDKRGFYFDYYDGAIIPRYTIAALWALIAQIIPADRVAKVINVLRDTKRFNRPVPVPSLAACEPEYDPETSYWRGPVWPCTNYMVLRGLRANGEEEFAKEIAMRYYNANAELFRSTGTIWENISSEQYDKPKASQAMKDFVGWGGDVAVTIAREFLGFIPQ